MPRGRKKMTSYSEQIAELEGSIASLRSELKCQETALKELRERHVQEEMSRLYEVLQARQLNVDDVLAMLNETKAEEAAASPAHLHIVAN